MDADRRKRVDEPLQAASAFYRHLTVDLSRAPGAGNNDVAHCGNGLRSLADPNSTTPGILIGKVGV